MNMQGDGDKKTSLFSPDRNKVDNKSLLEENDSSISERGSHTSSAVASPSSEDCNRKGEDNFSDEEAFGGSEASGDIFTHDLVEEVQDEAMTDSIDMENMREIYPQEPVPDISDDEKEDVLPEMAIQLNMRRTRSSQMHRWKSTRVSDELIDTRVPIDFLKDKPRHMTWSRRIALFLMRYKWYYPGGKKNISEGSRFLKGVHHRDDLQLDSTEEVDELFPFTQRMSEKPSLEKAWAYFEHFTLPRYFVEPEQESGLWARLFYCFRGTDLRLARRGDNRGETRLYPAFFTPLSQLGDFGIGVGLYFSTLRVIILLTFLAGVLNIGNIYHYAGNEYSANQNGVHSFMRGTAICTDKKWVPCPTCQYKDFDEDERTRERIANVTVPGESGNDTTLIFALRNLCEVDTNSLGMINYATLLLLVLGIFILHFYQERKEIEFDEDTQTAQDYSIIITNPPRDAIDPDEWKTFFESNFRDVHVTVCTVSVDNDMLVRTLVERRECMKQIEMMLPIDESIDTLNLAKIAAKTEKNRRIWERIAAKFVPGIPELFGRIVVLTAKIQGLAQWSRPAKNIFITFETESAQRRVLSQLSVGLIDAMRNNTSKISNTNHLFRGKVLYAREADEPSTVRWKDLNQRHRDMLFTMAQTTIVSVGAIALIALIISACKGRSAIYAAIAISIFNTIFPEFAKFLTNFESHRSEGIKQTSLYLKIAAFRWVNTAIVITIITPFMATLETGNQALIPTVYTIFFTEIITTNVIQITDLWGHFQRHFLAPRGKTQERMNMNMRGTPYELAERYTNVTKIFFLAVYYCAIYPAAFFMCSFALSVNFITDRFSLLRTWEKTPQLGTRLTKFSRKYFFTAIILSMAISSSYFWSGFPYDNLCIVDGGGIVREGYIGTWNASTEGKKSIQVTVDSEDHFYKFCLQDLMKMDGKIAFPASPRHQPEGSEWMSPDQEKIVELYGWTSLGILVVVVIFFVWDFLLMIWNLYSYSHKPKGRDQKINYSDVDTISAFVPQVESKFFPYPLLCCSIEGVGKNLLDWSDPDRPHEFYDLTIDAEKVLRGDKLFADSSTNVFSKIKHWQPGDKEAGSASNREFM